MHTPSDVLQRGRLTWRAAGGPEVAGLRRSPPNGNSFRTLSVRETQKEGGDRVPGPNKSQQLLSFRSGGLFPRAHPHHALLSLEAHARYGGSGPRTPDRWPFPGRMLVPLCPVCVSVYRGAPSSRFFKKGTLSLRRCLNALRCE